jgi:uncharacterized membrane protein YidH (DUF202 family)
MQPAVRDPGLQAERTALAWARTALAVLANALLVLRFGWSSQRVAFVALGISLVLGAGATLVIGLRRHRELTDAVAPGVAPTGAIAAVATIAATAAAIGLLSLLPAID